jgi:type II secretory pathway component PulM
MSFVIILAVLVVVVLFVSAPLRRVRQEAGRSGELAELEAAREAKYREIRDAELDRRTGKLSEGDYEAIDRSLRAEAVEILKALDEAREPLPSAD